MNKSVDETIAELRAQPGIDISRLEPGTIVSVETTQHVFELNITYPHLHIMRVSGTDPRLRDGVTAELIGSTYDKDGLVALPHWIGQGLKMHFRFMNGIYDCTSAMSARVIGPTYHYDVF